MKKSLIYIAVFNAMMMVSGCGGSDNGERSNDSSANSKGENNTDSQNIGNIQSTPYIAGQILDKNSFNIPCYELISGLADDAKQNRNYIEIQFESRSTGIVFRIVLPTKRSLYENTLGKYKVLGPVDVDTLNPDNKFLLNVKVPYGDLFADNAERFYSNSSYYTDLYYTELINIIEEKKENGNVTLLLRFKFNHEMLYYKAGNLQSNSELNNGELLLRVEVLDA
ncbi:hypothetical protein GCM10023206_24610 [Acinetobacter puyangensis]|uniref:Lipoprotein n=1 Tax=Acinetobacter puyangensis TaxID=1096779 RepID=A0A240E5G6_9GAMM|nr:hypothetical protein [Acinetobacter puyangensis]SNX43771.1 hypothetical protein SAMN05421731_101815 [Acinetobacter puyangensis]